MRTQDKVLDVLTGLAHEYKVDVMVDPEYANTGTVRYQHKILFNDIATVRYDFQDSRVTLVWGGGSPWTSDRSDVFSARPGSPELDMAIGHVRSRIRRALSEATRPSEEE